MKQNSDKEVDKLLEEAKEKAEKELKEIGNGQAEKESENKEFRDN